MSTSSILRVSVVVAALVGIGAMPDDSANRPLRVKKAPELAGVTQWINSEPLTFKQLRGKVVVVHFWTNGCYNCRNNYEHYRSWQKRYEGKDVVIIGIHTPETSGEHDIARIEQQASKHGLKFPIAVDNDGVNWQAWKNQYWPAVYVVDRKGEVRYGWEGELNYNGRKGEETVRRWIDRLLIESGNEARR